MKDPRTFRGREIAPALVEAFEHLPSDCEIAEVTAGENMPIRVTYAVWSGGVIIGFDACTWDGARWEVERIPA